MRPQTAAAATGDGRLVRPLRWTLVGQDCWLAVMILMMLLQAAQLPLVVFVVDKGRGLRLASCLRCAVDGRVGLAVAKCFGIKMPPGFLPARVLRSDGQTPAGLCARVCGLRLDPRQ